MLTLISQLLLSVNLMQFQIYLRHTYILGRLKMPKTPEFKFIKDEPLDSTTGLPFNFYHASLAPALKKIIKSKDTPRTIGLFGSWGTGKSTIIKMLENDKGLKDYPIFVFDAWKYQNDALRRTFLIQFKDFLTNRLEIAVPENILEDFYVGTTKTQQNTIKKKKKWYQIVGKFLKSNPLFDVFLGGLIISLAAIIWFSSNQIVTAVISFLTTITSISIVAYLLKEILKPLLGEMIKAIAAFKSGSTSEGSITYTKNQLNSPEQFEGKFADLLNLLKKKKVIIVFDNIDRVSGEIAVTMLSTIKTFMEPKTKSEVISVIPLDSNAISVRVKSFYHTDSPNDQEATDMADEYLRKIFSLILWLPDYTPTDLEAYTRKKLSETGEISELILDDDVVLVICSAYRKNPRDIIQFINNLTALVISAHHSNVKNILLDDVAYLAKVQVIRQKFPKAYKELQSNWNNPENVDGGNDDFKSFMLSTSRITVDDAEPFIFFKDPMDNYGISNTTDIKNALLSGDSELFKSSIKGVDGKALTMLIIDLMKKYRYIDDELANIYNTQFSDFFDEVPDGKKKHYIDSLASTVDTDLWRTYRSIDIDNTFKLITQPKVRDVLQTRIVDRYMQAFDSSVQEEPNDDDIKFAMEVIKNSTIHLELFSVEQIVLIRKHISNVDKLNKQAIDYLIKDERKGAYVSNEALIKYLTNSSSQVIAGSMTNLTKYAGVINKAGSVEKMLNAFKDKFVDENTKRPEYNDEKVKYARSVSTFMSTLKDELKAAEVKESPDAESLFVLLQANYNNATTDDDKIAHLIAIWWLRDYVTEYTSTNIVSVVNGFIASSDKAGIESLLSHWSGKNLQNVINNHFESTLYSRAISDVEIAHYLISISDSAGATKVLSYIVSNTPISGTLDSDLIIRLKSIDDPEALMTALTSKLISNSNYYDKRYDSAFKSLVKRKSGRSIKEMLAKYISKLIEEDDVQKTDNGISLFNSQSIADVDRETILSSLSDVVAGLSSPYDEYDLQKIQFLFQNKKYANSAVIPAVVTHLFEMLNSQQDVETTNGIFDAFSSHGGVSYVTDVNLISTAFSSIDAWPDSSLKKYAFNKLISLKSDKPDVFERKFWDDVNQKIDSVDD